MEHQTLTSLQLTGGATLPHKGLTLREAEILKWSAEGKTAAEVAMILDLKLRTVNFHIGTAIRKMGVTNKTSAVVQAALHGVF
ncbi:helix-turn-helix domain-containing protein [Pseudomonas sp. S2_H01]